MLILVAAAVLAWRGGLLSRSNVSTTLTETPAQPIAVGQPAASAPVSQPAVTGAKPAEPPASTKPAQSTPAPSAARTPVPSVPASASTSPPVANARAMPDVTGKTILEARELLRNAGFRFLIRLSTDRSRTPGIVLTQTLDESTGATESRRVLLTAVAISTVFVHVAKGDERRADDLVAFLKDQSSTIGSIVRAQSVGPRAEMIGRVGYSEDRLAAQAESIAKDASAYLTRTGTPRILQVTLSPRVIRGAIIVALYERAQ